MMNTEKGCIHSDDTGAVIRQARKEKGYTLAQLAARVDMSTSYMSDIEHGRAQPSLKVLRALVDELGIELATRPVLTVYPTEWQIIKAFRSGGYAGVLRHIAKQVERTD